MLGCFFLTNTKPGLKGEGKCFSGAAETIMAYQENFVDLRAIVKVRVNGQVIETTPGRLIFNEILPLIAMLPLL